MKEIISGFKKFFTIPRIIVLLVILVLGYSLLQYSGSKSLFDGMQDGNAVPPTNPTTDNNQSSMQNTPVQSVTTTTTNPLTNPSDLLPKDQHSQWSSLNPNLTSGGVYTPTDLLDAGYNMGINSISTTLRNTSLDIREQPIIPKNPNISPWNISTIEPDYARIGVSLG